MDFNQVVERAKAVLLSPKSEWPNIAARPETVESLYKNYLLIIAAVPAIANFVHQTIIGISLPFGGTIRVGLVQGLISMVASYLGFLAVAYVLALVIDALAPNFGGQKNRVQALKTIVYASTAGAVASVGWIVPLIGGLIVFAGGLYTLYLLYVGLPITMKVPQDKALGYTGLVIVASFVIGLLFSVVIGAFGAGAGSLASQNAVHFDKDSVLGKIEERAKKADGAAKDLDAAQNSGDPEAQKAAMGKFIGALSGSDATIEALPPDRIKAFLPENLAGMPRTETSAERNSAMGMQVSTASGVYADKAQGRLSLDITDMGSAKGFAALASWAQFEQEKESDNGFEKTYKADGRTVHEEWNSTDKSGAYSVIVGERFLVKVSGAATDIDALKHAAESVNVPGLEALKDEGVKKGG